MRTAALLAIFGLVAAACGTLADDEAFERAQAGSEPVDAAGDLDVDGRSLDPLADPADPLAGSEDGAQGTAAAGPQPGGAGPGSPTSGDDAAPAPGGETAATAEENFASDVGVTATSIKVGNIASRGGMLGPHQSTPPYFGANAYFQLVNARGGINGRQVEFVTCDDREDPGENIRCAQRLVEQEEVFALTATSTRSYAGASYVSQQGVPDVGGIPIGNEYYTYPGLYGLYGSEYPRDGTVGDNGTLHWSSHLGRWYKDNVGVTQAAVFYYNIAISKEIGELMAESLRAEGIDTVEYEINPALPDFDSRVIDMDRRGVDFILHAMDMTANLNLCRAMQRRDFQPKVVLTTIAGWVQTVSDFPQICRDVLFTGSKTQPASDTADPRIAEFHDTMRRLYGGQFDGRMHQWHFEGWLAAMLFEDAVARLGADVTRAGVMRHMDGIRGPAAGGAGYTWDGLSAPVGWAPGNWRSPPARNCITVARWSDEAGDFVTVAGTDNCPPGSWLPYRPTS